ncbi:MAG: helix-hairpin-helix domain-containing protein [Gammaproteobacteria bacterium]|nr:helix-hairpin-helix domain-containing protein [Gammaproteobacteria bacterium]
MQNRASKNRLAFNHAAAVLLRDMAELLSQQKANPFRINAYRRAAQTLDSLDVDAREILERDGEPGLIALPAIGRGIASSVAEIARTGNLSQLERLRGSVEPEALFQTVPGIGPESARLIHDELHVDTLEELELAAHDGRLEALPRFGPRRVAAVQASLASTLGRASPRARHDGAGPSVGLLLEIDAEYREKAASDKLPKIAPKRFNPKGEAWLPILHAQRNGWHFTALFSNTARAHELKRTRDWVVIYFYDDHHEEGQHTVVTETHGRLEGKRVVRGREAESARFYADN